MDDLVTEAFDPETQAIERAISNDDASALAAMVAYYWAEAAEWKGVAEERAFTIRTLKEILAHQDITGEPS